MLPIHVQKAQNAQLPEYQTPGSAGCDIHALLEEPVVIQKGKSALIPTGIYLSIPEGYEAQIRPRSGLAIKHGITLMNSPGTIDSDYRGEIKIIMTNLGSEDFIVTNKMRIAQMIFNKVYRAHFIETENLDETSRSEGGFGHSGI